jgi:hypothetical protein
MSKLTPCSLGALAFLVPLLLTSGGGSEALAQSGPNEQINQIGQPAAPKQTGQPTSQSQSTSQNQPTTQRQKLAASKRPRGQQLTTDQQIQRSIKQYVPQQYQQYLQGAGGEAAGGMGGGGNGM